MAWLWSEALWVSLMCLEALAGTTSGVSGMSHGGSNALQDSMLTLMCGCCMLWLVEHCRVGCLFGRSAGCEGVSDSGSLPCVSCTSSMGCWLQKAVCHKV